MMDTENVSVLERKNHLQTSVLYTRWGNRFETGFQLKIKRHMETRRRVAVASARNIPAHTTENNLRRVAFIVTTMLSDVYHRNEIENQPIIGVSHPGTKAGVRGINSFRATGIGRGIC